MAYSRTLNHFTSMQELATIWASSTSYVVNQLVINSNKLYRCLIAHTSTASFATDLGAGNWVEVSASASDVKNYISNGNFENSSTTGWNLARSTLDATTKLPNQASGSWAAAAGTLSRTIVTSGQLSGVASLSLASSAATTAGDMLVTDALTLDLEAQASVQTFSFYYRVTSGAANGNFSGTSSNSIGVAIYVVDGALAGTWIQPAGVWSVNTASSVTAITAKAAGTFQVPSDATQVRLAVYFPNATTGAITVYLDDFVLGPQVVQYGAPVTDWQDYTLTVGATTTAPTFGTVVVNKARWRRVGDSMEIQYQYRQSSAAVSVGSGTYLYPLPAGYQIDTSKLDLSSTQIQANIVGAGAMDGSSNSYMGNVGVYDSTRLQLLLGGDTAQPVAFSNTFQQTYAQAIVRLSFTARVPILGWSSSVQMSNDTDTRVVAASVAAGSAVNANNTTVIVPFGSTIVDTHAGIGVNQYTVPVPGYYRVVAQTRTSFPTSNISYNHTLSVFKNAVSAAQEAYQGDGGNASGLYWMFGSVNTIIQCNAGDVLTVRFGTNYNLGNSSTGLTTFSAERLSGPSAIAASETVAARYYTAAGPAINNTTPTIVYGTKVYDSHGAYNTTTGIYTIPVSGKYRFTNQVLTVTTAFPAGVFLENSIFVNGSSRSSVGSFRVCAAITTLISAQGSAELDLIAGDQVTFRTYSDTASTLYTLTPGFYNFINISRIGN